MPPKGSPSLPRFVRPIFRLFSWQNHRITMSQNKERNVLVSSQNHPPPPAAPASRRPVPPRPHPFSPGLRVPFLSHSDWVSALPHLDNFSSNLECFSTRALSAVQGKPYTQYIYISLVPALTQMISPCDKPWNPAITFTEKPPRCSNPPPPRSIFIAHDNSRRKITTQNYCPPYRPPTTHFSPTTPRSAGKVVVQQTTQDKLFDSAYRTYTYRVS